jgi:hypothetical protein
LNKVTSFHPQQHQLQAVEVLFIHLMLVLVVW